jgi:hypothetical protein
VNPLRGIVADLVERRLWPVAVVLVAALIAGPTLLLTSAPKPPAAPLGAESQPAPALAAPALSLSTPPSGPVEGTLKNPFLQQHVPKPTSTSTTVSPVTLSTLSSGTSSSGSSSSGTSSSSSSGSSRSSGSSSSGSATPAQPGVRIAVRFGRVGGTRATHHIGETTALPSRYFAVLVFLTLGKDGKTASFLISSDAQAQGDGRCEPNASICSTLLLKPGQTETFDVLEPGGDVQYRLDYLSVVSSG